MKVSDLARRAGVTRDTVRHYLRIGLIEAGRDPSNGYHAFDSAALSRLRFIRRSRQLGFRLDEIRSLFAHADSGQSACPEARRIIQHRIRQTHDEVHELMTLQQRMEDAAHVWQSLPDQAPSGDSVCHLIENWDSHD